MSTSKSPQRLPQRPPHRPPQQPPANRPATAPRQRPPSQSPPAGKKPRTPPPETHGAKPTSAPPPRPAKPKKKPPPPAEPSRFEVTPMPEPEPLPPERQQFRRKRWGLCHPGIAIPVVAVLTLLLRVHPCIVCAIILLMPSSKNDNDEDSWVRSFGPWILFVQSFILIFVVILMFTAVMKELPALLIPYVIVQLLALGVWLMLTIYAVVAHSNTAIGIIIISGIGAVFDLWSMITTIAAYMDIRGFNRYYEIEDAPVKEKPVEKITEKKKSDEAHISEVWRNLDSRPLPKRYRRPQSKEESTAVEQPSNAPQYKTRYAPQTTSDDSSSPRPTRPSRKPRLDAVKER